MIVIYTAWHLCKWKNNFCKFYLLSFNRNTNGKKQKFLKNDSIEFCSIIRGNQLASAGEDGSVRLWDLRTNENTNILQPHLVDKVARPKLGKWIGAVDFTEDWLVSINNQLSSR